MFQSLAFDAFFIEATAALKPYLGDLVCIGGCANALYRYHEQAHDMPFPYLGTKDIDWASPQKLLQGKRKSIAELMIAAQFREEIMGSQEKAVVKYIPKDENLAADIEFLCSESGLPGGRSRSGTPLPHAVQPGLMVQPLRYLELLRHNTWKINLDLIPEFVALHNLRIRIPNPAAYVVQKVLIRDQRRSSQSAAKDCYYIYEVAVIFRNALDALAQEAASLRETFKPWLKRFPKIADALFADENAEGPVSALQVFTEMGGIQGVKTGDLTAEMISKAVAKLLGAMK